MAVRQNEAHTTAHLALPDGRRITFKIRSSQKARTLRLKLSAREGLLVTAPDGVERTRIMRLVSQKADWILKRLTEFDAVRHLFAEAKPVRPHAFNLPALAESWRVEYRKTKSLTVAAKTDQSGRIVVAGAIEDVEACRAALRRWLARHAKSAFASWLGNVSRQHKLRYQDLVVKNQRTRWGSCAPNGRISLNCKLLFLPREQVRYVMAHELCHTIEHNHSQRFWTHLRHFEPDTDKLHGQMRDAWRLVPTWAQRGSGTQL